MKNQEAETFETVRNIFIKFLKKNSYRKTPERFLILKEIYFSKGHFNVEDLYFRLRKNKGKVSRATLYNTIDLLLTSNLIIKHQFGRNCAQYEKSFDFKQHDHVICLNCGKILEFQDPKVQEIKKSVEKKFNINVSHHSLIFYAECKDHCKGKNNN